MTFLQLRYFCTTCRCHSITGAAKELYVTQPAISLAIKDLEEEFETALFHRQGSKLTLTPAGRQLYERAIYILQYCNDMQQEISSIGKNAVPLRIGIPPVLSSIFFPGMLTAYKKAYDGGNVILEEFGSVKACKMVQNDDLDLALVNMEQYDIDHFNCRVLLNDQLVFCVSPAHPFAGRDVINWEDLDRQDIILFNNDSVQNTLLKARFQLHNITPHIIMQGSQLFTIINFLRSGTVGSFLYESILSGFPKFKGIPLSSPIKTNIGIVWKKGRYMTEQMQHFIEFSSHYFQNTDL